MGPIDQALTDRAAHHLLGQFVEGSLVAIGQHLRVAGGAQHRGQFTKLIKDPGVVGQPERARRGLQQAADRADGHPHLMHGVLDVSPHGAIPREQRLDLLGHRAVHGIIRARGRSLRAHRRAEHPRQFRRVLGGCRTGIAQPVAQPRQQLLVGATPGDRVLGQLEFPLPPPLFGVLVRQPRR